MVTIRVGAQIQPQQASYTQMREAWLRVEDMGADTLFCWDHFFPLYGESDGPHFECWSLLAAMGEVTSSVEFGALVTCNGYRNPNLLADMARTIDHISDGRLILGIGSGWFARDYDEYGYPFGTAVERLRDLEANLPVIEARFAKLNPPPTRQIPVLIGGGGEKLTLRLVAQHATIWNGFGAPEEIGRKSRILDDWCAKVGRDPQAIERSILGEGEEYLANADAYVKQGITHLIVGCGGPDFDLEPLRRLIAWREGARARMEAR